jgi:hypothetical protein
MMAFCAGSLASERFNVSNPRSQVPLIARNQLALAVLKVRDRPETVVLQLENVIGMVERLPHQAEPHGVNAREHNSSLSLRLWMPAPPLGNGFLQLALERVWTSRVSAQTSSGFAETNQLIVRHLAQAGAQFEFVAGFDFD